MDRRIVLGSYLVFGFSCSLLLHLGHLLYAVALLRNKELVFWGGVFWLQQHVVM